MIRSQSHSVILRPHLGVGGGFVRNWADAIFEAFNSGYWPGCRRKTKQPDHLEDVGSSLDLYRAAKWSRILCSAGIRNDVQEDREIMGDTSCQHEYMPERVEVPHAIEREEENSCCIEHPASP